MAQIEIVFDNKLKKPEIQIPLTNTSRTEAGDYYTTNWQQLQQTSVYGIETPLIMIGKIVVDFKDIISFNLRSIGPTPQLDMEVVDRDKLLSTVNTPGLDNQVVVQIIPPFDNAYKKINLVFAISNISIKNNNIKLSCVYKIPKLFNSSVKSFGNITTFNLFKEIAIDTELGFASNCQDDESDKRCIYSDSLTYLELMNKEITRSHSDESHIYDYWIDFWDNINYVNIFERYNAKDSDEDMMIWVAGVQHEFEENIKIQPLQIKATINNHPVFANSDLKTNSYEIVNNTGSYIGSGTDKVYGIYEEDKDEYLDHLIQDGDVKNDIYIKYEYLGEVYGEYNYLLAAACRSSYLKKMNTETIKVTIKKPLLALMRGSKVDFLWYINDDQWKYKMQSLSDAEVIEENKNIKTTDELSTEEDIKGYNPGSGEFIIDKSISGQYTIIGCTMRYYMGEWFYELLLTRPHINKPKILKEEE